MIAKHNDSRSMEHKIQRRIKIKQSQLQIAVEGNMPHVAQGLKRQLVELKMQIKLQAQTDLQPESDFQALMSLVDD